MKTPVPPEPLPGHIASHNGATPTVITMSQTVTGVAQGEIIYSEGRVLGKVDSVASANITLFTKILEPNIPVGAATNKVYIRGKGNIDRAGNIHGMSDFSAQGGTTSMLTNFWPCGSRGGPLVSRLDGYAMTSAAWHLPQSYTHAGVRDCSDGYDGYSPDAYYAV